MPCLRGAHNLMPNELSGGMSRHVALARAIALDPLLAMYDEPFAGLNPISLNVIAELIRRLNDALGISSIVVTYDVSESLKVADYVYFIDSGVVVAGGPARRCASPTIPPCASRPCRSRRAGGLPLAGAVGPGGSAASGPYVTHL